MRPASKLLVSFIVLTLAASCISSSGFKRPIVRECTTLSAGTWFCLYRETEEVVSPEVGFTCLAPDDRKVYEEYLDSIERRLAQCLNDRKKCR